MTGNGMASQVVAAIEALDASLTPDQKTQLTNGWQAICGAIVSYIQGNADVSPNTLANPSGQAVAVNTSSGVGSTTAPQTITGLGKIL